MRSERFGAGGWPAFSLLAALVALVAGCVAPPPAPLPEPTPTPAPTLTVPTSPVTEAPVPAAAFERNQVLAAAVDYADRVRTLPSAELGQEIQRLGDTAYAPLPAVQLALALGKIRTTPNTARAQSLLQRVIADPTPEAQALQPFARVLSAQIADQRRADEQAERQAQQLRDAQRRIEQLNDRLEAVRAIERSLPGPERREPNRP
jgi:primosomal protein N''